MGFIFSYLKKYIRAITGTMAVKLVGTGMELLIPYVLEHMIDHVVPTKEVRNVLIWGAIMLLLAAIVRFLNVGANRLSVKVARDAAEDIRRDLFHRSLNLSSSQVDKFTLPSIISRMTSDTYNVQNFIQSVQTIGIRAPIMLVGGIFVTLRMDRGLAMILCVTAPIMIAFVVMVSRYGIPLYDTVQKKMDVIVRIMRENITGVRVVKALSREEHEKARFGRANDEAVKSDIRAGITMSLPGPFVSFSLNIGLTAIVWFGAQRVNAGVTEPGVILAFLTYFNMILMGVMGLNRIFMLMSKANASANRIAGVVREEETLAVLSEAEAPRTGEDGYIIFDHVTFRYDPEEGSIKSREKFAGEEREDALSDISFSVKKGGSLGIIGATGSGKSTIVRLLMRFYDPAEGKIFIGGRDVRTYEKDELHRLFGVTLQNDAIFADTIRTNIALGRDISDEEMKTAAKSAQAAEFIANYRKGFEHKSEIHGANFSGGQKQRILITRALAARPPILIFDDASSALDYRTDAEVRKAVREEYAGATEIVIAQRVSSLMGLDEILVLADGKIIGKGTHGELLRTCPEYRDIARSQMGEVG